MQNVDEFHGQSITTVPAATSEASGMICVNTFE